MTDTQGKLPSYLAQQERRSRTKRWLLLVLLVLVILALVWATFSYLSNGRLAIPVLTSNKADQLNPPEYLYSIAGPAGQNALTEPIGVAVSRDGRVYVADNKKAVVRCYDTDGTYRFSFNRVRSGAATALAEPGRVAISPSGEVWVTDRRLRSVFVFSPEGEFVRTFKPPVGVAKTWAPIWVSFDTSGSVYVCDVGNNARHQVLVFDEQGQEKAHWGKTKAVEGDNEAPGEFYYPNGVAVAKNGDVFVSDSNNRRIQVFDSAGKFKYFIATSGTPRGLAIDGQQRLYVVDALAHLVDLYTLKGKHLVGFGGFGVEIGKFQYPTDVSLDRRGRIYVSDRENNQVQVWGWPTVGVPPIQGPKDSVQWAICLSPLLLLLVPLLRRRRAFVVTDDFISSMADADRLDLMTERRFLWRVPVAEMPKYEGKTLNGVQLDQLLTPTPHSESDVTDFIERTGVDYDTAVLLLMSKRTGRLASEQPELRSASRAMGVQVFDHTAFIERYSRGVSSGGATGNETP